MMTYWKRCEFEGDPPWDLVMKSEGNYAAIATRDFEIGDTIVKERALVWTDGWHPFTSEQVADIDQRIDQLSVEEKDAFFSMANVFPEVPPCAGIFMTNSFDMPADSENKCGMFLAIARLNHSCCPNAQQTFYPDCNQQMLRASRRIEKGDEINDCYIELRQNREQRKEQLQKYYRFDCSCKSCVLQDKDQRLDDKYRCSSLETEDKIISVASEDPHAALELAASLLKLLEKEVCRGWSERYLAGAHLSNCQLARSLGMKKKAVKHIKKAIHWNDLLQGVESPDSKRARQIFSELNLLAEVL